MVQNHGTLAILVWNMSRRRETLRDYGFLWNINVPNGEKVIHQNSFQEANCIPKEEMLGSIVLGAGIIL